MTLLSSPAERHSLVFVRPAPWRDLLARRDDLRGVPLLADWVDRGWPLIARRPGSGDDGGVPLGLPLPPALGKLRVAVLMRSDDVAAIRPPPALAEAQAAAPAAWTDVILHVLALAASHRVTVRVFGGLAWQFLTGLGYLTDASDLDLLIPCGDGIDVGALTAGLAGIEAGSSLRIDGEIVRVGGAAAHWRELHTGAAELLVKSIAGATLLSRDRFLGGSPP